MTERQPDSISGEQIRASGAGRFGRPATANPAAILDHLGWAAYRWTIAGDRLVWSDNACKLLQVSNPSSIGTGAEFTAFLRKGEPSRVDAIVNSGIPDHGPGVEYSVEYAFQPGGAAGATLWLCDSGRWFCGADGRPAVAEGVVRIVPERHDADRQAEYNIRHDPLTGQLNRAALFAVLDETLGVAQRGQTHACFLVAAVDNLAIINDAYGFAAADEMLIGVAGRIRDVMRTGDALGRLSGNKFGIVVGNCTESEMAAAAARFIEAVSSDPILVSEGPIPVSLSIGGVALPRYARSAHAAVVAAQDTLTAARKKGRGHFAVYAHDAQREAQRKRNITIADELVRALNDRRVGLALHPVIDSRSGDVAFYECLTRLHRPDGTVVPASEFIDLAERLGLVRNLDLIALDAVAAMLRDDPELTVSLNVSMVTAGDSAWYSRLNAHALAAPGITSRLIVEITETVAINDMDSAVHFVQSLRDMGCTVAIDDFGAGFTNYRNMRALNADIVKIDGVFIRELLSNPEDQIFVHTLVELARHGGLKVVGEWVENEETAELLRQWGVDYLQGSLFADREISSPLSGADVGGRKAISA
ncbi:MAG: EAL domain-containing protein [Rhodobiaceae bacterium]|nr:EAL domain-containing protein [Rhodobiaceae bacterium]MCC0056812.1 EAL domain-containing protein [Rhodobiaceae bacterium]